MIQSYNNTKRDVVIITCFAANEPRAEYVRDFFEKRGKSTLIISTDFIHRGKYYRKDTPEGYGLIKTRPYEKNLSVSRLYSHHKFAEEAMKLAVKYQPELVYVMIPANSLAKFAGRYKKQNQCKLVLDIIDLWPESLPIPIKENIWPLSVWRRLRDKNLIFADVIITECDLYQNKLHLDKLNIPVKTVYWPQKDYGDISEMPQNQDVLKFLYLGSINNIVDIDGIANLLGTIQQQKKIELHIVGDGERKDQFLKLLKERNIPVNFHGYIYEHAELKEIASQCHWGINLMKDTVQIGLTMKSVSYFGLGLPIVNNLKGDTWELLKQYRAGINVDKDTIAIENLFDYQKMDEMRFQARKMFEELFSKVAFETQLAAAIHNLYEDF